jgi:hypothetical protein
MAIVNDFPKNAEYWRAVDGFPNYEVSTDGRARIIKTGKIMKLTMRKDGYVVIGFTKDSIQTQHRFHIIVATAHCNKEDHCNFVDHIDRNRANNNYKNLRWVTGSINNRNTSMTNRNTSGYQGVLYDKCKSWVANWYDVDTMKPCRKSFSVNKYGEELAKELAINYRKYMALENGYLI